MKYIKYTKYTGEAADSIDLNDLVNQLSDFFLQSGFESQYYGFSEMDTEHTMDQLREAIRRALENGDLLPDDMLEQMLDAEDSQQKMEELIDKLVDRLMNEGYINPLQPPHITPPPSQTPQRWRGTRRKK